MAPNLSRPGAQLLHRCLPIQPAKIPLRTVTTKSCKRNTFLQPTQVSFNPSRSNGSRTLATATGFPPTKSTAHDTRAESMDNLPDPELSENDVRMPRTVQAIYLRPLKRKAKYGVPVCNLQLRSYSVRNMDLMADFALRAAYYLNIPASGPIPLPKMIERWTVSRSPFVHKKSKENFERITLRRLIQIQDAHPDVVQVWLAYLRKHSYWGVGMKANVWEHSPLAVGKAMEAANQEMKEVMEDEWKSFGRRKTADPTEKIVEQMHKDPV